MWGNCSQLPHTLRLQTSSLSFHNYKGCLRKWDPTASTGFQPPLQEEALRPSIRGAQRRPGPGDGPQGMEKPRRRFRRTTASSCPTPVSRKLDNPPILR